MSVKKGVFEEKLRILHELGNELSLTVSVKDLCRSAVELGRKRLGFDRLSTWFIDAADPKYLIGSFGVDEKGDIREETAERVTIGGDPAMRQIHAKRAHSLLREDVPLRDNGGNMVGRGSHIIAAIWNGREIIGYLSTDNLLRREPLTEEDREITELFASTFGHLYSLKIAESALQAAYGQLKDVHAQLIQAAKMEVVGGLATGVAHEVKNPLAIILQGLEYLSKKIKTGDEDTLLTLQRMRGAVKKAKGIVNGLLDFSTFSELTLTAQNLNSVMESSLFLIKHQIDERGIKITKDFADRLPPVMADKNKIEQVFINVLLNALDQLSADDKLIIRTHASCAPDKDWRSVIVEVEDTGPGIPANILSKLFDPFVTTRRASGGTGLGLSIVRNIMNMHNGKINIENVKEGHGAKVTLEFRAQG